MKKTGLFLALAVIAVYGNTILNGFAFDDIRAVVYNEEIKSLDNIFNVARSLRGVRMITYMLDYSLFGLSPAPYHMHNVLWHIAAVLLAYCLSLKILKDEKAAIISTFIFAVHPLHVEAVANISNRKEMICFVFFASSIISYINIFSAADRKRKISWGLISLLCFLLAFKSKEIAVTIPAMLVIYELLFVKKERRLILHARFAWLKAVTLILALAFSVSKFADYLFLSSNLYYFHYRLSGELMEYTHIINNIFTVFIYYLRNYLFPVNLLPDYFIPAQGELFSLTFIFYFSCFIFLLYVIYLSYLKNRAACFAILWLLVNYLVISPLNLGVYPLCDRYLYLPSLGLCMVSGLALKKGMVLAADQKGYGVTWKMLIGLVFFGLSLLSINYNTYWKDNIVLWTKALSKNPESRLGRISLASEYGKMGLFDEAEALIIKMGDLDPRDITGGHAKMILSEIYYRRGEKDRAFEAYRSVTAKVDHANPKITYPYIMKFARFFKRSGLYKEALEAYSILEDSGYMLDRVTAEISLLKRRLEEESMAEIEALERLIQSSPLDIRPRVNLAIIYYNIASYDKAERLLKESLKIKGTSFEASYNLGLVYEKTGMFDKAAAEFEKALSLRAKAPPVAHDNLGLVYMKLERYEDAIDQFSMAVKIDEKFALSYLHMGDVYLFIGKDRKAVYAYKAFLKNWKGEEHYRRVVENLVGDLLHEK